MTIQIASSIDLVRRLAREDQLQARLTLVGLASSLVAPQKIDLLVVGGTAVDLYVGGGLGTSTAYPAGWDESLDVDTIALRDTSGTPTQVVATHLADAGFEILGPQENVRFPGVPFILDFVGFGYPDDYSSHHEVTVAMPDWQGLGLAPVRVAGPEDILFDYLESGVDTRHQRDWARALAIASAMEGRLDLGYLYTKAHWRLHGALVPWLDRLLAGEPLLAQDRAR